MTGDVGGPGTDQELKARHRAVWASGDYPAVAAELIPDLGPVLVNACRIDRGQRVLDVAAGAGNAAIPAARAGASVVASDLTPELLDVGRMRAEAEGLDLDWVPADVEALPFGDGEFDVVMSCVGAMFAPHHRSAAAEMLRVCRPGGRIGLINWTPEGFVGGLLRTLGLYGPPPPPGAQPPTLWGSADHVREQLGGGVSELACTRGVVVMNRCTDPAEFREYWKSRYGPTIAVYRHNEADPERTAALDEDFLRLLSGSDRGGFWEAEYLLVTATRN